MIAFGVGNCTDSRIIVVIWLDTEHNFSIDLPIIGRFRVVEDRSRFIKEFYMKTIQFAVIFFAVIGCSSAFSHGEDHPGPNGGSIQMPGAFHTEAVMINKNELKVFLLDMDWKNPTVKDSSVSVIFQTKTKYESKCEKNENAFICTFDKTADLNKKGKLIVSATREKQVGNTAEYKTPLKVWKK